MASTGYLKRGINHIGIGDVQDEWNRAPPHKRVRRPLSQFPPYHHHTMSRVSSQSYKNYGVDDVIASNSSFALCNNDSNTNNYQKPFVFGFHNNPNPQIVPLPVPVPLPYRNLNDDVSLDTLPEWVPNHPNHPVPVQSPVCMASVVSQSMVSQPIVLSKELTDFLSLLNNEKENLITPEASKTGELPPGLSFDNPSSLNVRHESVVNSLYSDMPRQCSSCGVRFNCQEEHSKHMDWHVRKNRTAKTGVRPGQQLKKSRGWLPSVSLWLSASTGGGLEQAAKPSFGGSETENMVEEQKQQLVPMDEEQRNCALCEEAFEDFFSHEHDDWMYKDAVYYTKVGGRRIVHAKCMA